MMRAGKKKAAVKRRRTDRPRFAGVLPAQPSTAIAKRSARLRATAAFLGVENKFFDSSRVSVALTAPTGAEGAEVDPTTLDCLNCPAQGDGPQSRDGRKIVMDSLIVSGNVRAISQAGQAAADTAPIVHIYCVLDTQTNAATLNSEDVFTNPSGSAVLATSVFHELENGKRFRTLAKRVLTFTPPPITGVAAGSTIEQSGETLPFEMFIPLKGMEVNFDKDQTTSVIAAIRDNSIHMIAYMATSAVPAVTLSYNARLRFRG